MKNRSVLLVALLVISALVVGWTTARPQQWEYQQTCSQKDLKDLGINGWELVTVTAQADQSTCFYLKRRN